MVSHYTGRYFTILEMGFADLCNLRLSIIDNPQGSQGSKAQGDLARISKGYKLYLARTNRRSPPSHTYRHDIGMEQI